MTAQQQPLEVALPGMLARPERQQQNRQSRKRAVGGGRTRFLKPCQGVLPRLVYLPHNVWHAMVGQMSGVCADTSENTSHELEGVMNFSASSAVSS